MSRDKRAKAIARLTLDVTLSLYTHVMELQKGKIQDSMDEDLKSFHDRLDNLPPSDDGYWTEENRSAHGEAVRAAKPPPAGLWHYQYSDREPKYITYEEAAILRNVQPHTMRVMISKSPIKAITIWKDYKHHVLSKTKNEAVMRRALRLKFEETHDEDDIFKLPSAPLAPRVPEPELPDLPKPTKSKAKPKALPTTL